MLWSKSSNFFKETSVNEELGSALVENDGRGKDEVLTKVLFELTL